MKTLDLETLALLQGWRTKLRDDGKTELSLDNAVVPVIIELNPSNIVEDMFKAAASDFDADDYAEQLLKTREAGKFAEKPTLRQIVGAAEEVNDKLFRLANTMDKAERLGMKISIKSAPDGRDRAIVAAIADSMPDTDIQTYKNHER